MRSRSGELRESGAVWGEYMRVLQAFNECIHSSHTPKHDQSHPHLNNAYKSSPLPSASPHYPTSPHASPPSPYYSSPQKSNTSPPTLAHPNTYTHPSRTPPHTPSPKASPHPSYSAPTPLSTPAYLHQADDACSRCSRRIALESRRTSGDTRNPRLRPGNGCWRGRSASRACLVGRSTSLGNQRGCRIDGEVPCDPSIGSLLRRGSYSPGHVILAR